MQQRWMGHYLGEKELFLRLKQGLKYKKCHIGNSNSEHADSLISAGFTGSDGVLGIPVSLHVIVVSRTLVFGFNMYFKIMKFAVRTAIQEKIFAERRFDYYPVLRNFRNQFFISGFGKSLQQN